MKRILVNMQNKLFASAVLQTIRQSEYCLDAYITDKPEDVALNCEWYLPGVLFLEVSDNTPWRLEERLEIAEKVKQVLPECKTVLMVDEAADKKAAAGVCGAKKDGLIDQFVYGSVSADYLLAILDTL